MKTYIISSDLDFYKKNFERCKASCEQYKVDYEVFKAVLPEDIPFYNEKYPYLIKSGNAKMYDERFYDVKKACFTSHFLLWMKCFETNQPIIILEEDTTVIDFFDYDLFHSMIKLPSTAIFLQPDNYTGCGYVITPAAAEKALSHVQAHGWKVNDKLMNKLIRAEKIDRYWTEKAYIRENALIGENNLREEGSLINFLSFDRGPTE